MFGTRMDTQTIKLSAPNPRKDQRFPNGRNARSQGKPILMNQNGLPERTALMTTVTDGTFQSFVTPLLVIQIHV